MCAARPRSTASHERYSSAPRESGAGRQRVPLLSGRAGRGPPGRAADPGWSSRRRAGRWRPAVATSRRSTCSIVIQCSSTPRALVLARTKAGGQEDRRALVAEARRVADVPRAFDVVRLEAGLLGQLAPGRDLQRFAVDVAGPGGDLEHGCARSAGRYWRTSVTSPSSGDRDDGHRAGVADHVALERLAVGVGEPRLRRPRTATLGRPRRSPVRSKPDAGSSPTRVRHRPDGRQWTGSRSVEVDQARLAALGPVERGAARARGTTGGAGRGGS